MKLGAALLDGTASLVYLLATLDPAFASGVSSRRTGRSHKAP
jgi:hypothetical protein